MSYFYLIRETGSTNAMCSLNVGYFLIYFQKDTLKYFYGNSF